MPSAFLARRIVSRLNPSSTQVLFQVFRRLRNAARQFGFKPEHYLKEGVGIRVLDLSQRAFPH